MAKSALTSRFVDMTGPFLTKADAAIDMALGTMASDVEFLAKQRVPVKQGLLSAAIQHKRKGLKRFVVEVNKEYARKMEFVQFQNYTTPGTGPFYLRDAGDVVKDKAVTYLKNAADTIRGAG